MRARILGVNRCMSSAVRRPIRVDTFHPSIARAVPEFEASLRIMLFKRTLKRLTIALSTLVLGVITGLLIYDLVQIRPHRSEIAAMLAAADPLERNPPPLLPRLQE